MEGTTRATPHCSAEGARETSGATPYAGQRSRAEPQPLSTSGAEFAAAVEREAQGRKRGRDVRVLRRLWPFMARYKLQIGAAFVFLLISSSATLLFGPAVREMINHGFSKENEG